jgi:ABC-type branched-subunit amino acid transport system ATPase component
MLAIGRSLMSKPKLLLLDEPSLGLAPLVSKEAFSHIKRINETEGSSKEMVVELYVSIPLCFWRDSRKAQQYISLNIEFLG